MKYVNEFIAAALAGHLFALRKSEFDSSPGVLIYSP